MVGLKKQNTFLPVFILFVLLSGLVIFLSQQKMFFGLNFFENAFFPVEGFFFHTAQIPSGWFANKKIALLEEENKHLTRQLVQMQQLQQDNAALHDQFQTTTIPSTSLLPAAVIGAPAFIPGITVPDTIVINKGKNDHVRVGDTVIYKINLIGQVTKVTDTASQVTLMSNTATSFLAKTSKTNAQGVLRGQGNGVMTLGNVVLSDKLDLGDIVVTNGSQNIYGKGFPPGLIVGKIVSIEKNPSALYQSASVESLMDFSKLSTVFVMQ